MKLTAQVKLLPTDPQKDSLRRTLEVANSACSVISAWCWANQKFGESAIHRTLYHEIRRQFPLTAQVVIRCQSRVADAYKSAFSLHRLNVKRVKGINQGRRKKNLPLLDLPVMEACCFKPHSSIAFDDRILRYQIDRRQVSIWTVDGRQTIPFVCGEHQRKMLETRQGESDLVLSGDNFLLLATCNVDELPPADTSGGVLGIDLGIVNIATDSNGRNYSGDAVNAYRKRVASLRAALQSKGTKSAKRHLKRIRRKQSRYMRDVNHCISKEIVKTAVAEHKALAFEDLKGIRERANGLGREMRRRIGSWAFNQLGMFTEYKARRSGVPKIDVDPRDTSRECSDCHFISKGNRKTQAQFKCLQCGSENPADFNAAANIGARAAQSIGLLQSAALC